MTTPMTVPPVVLGTMTFGDTADLDESARIFEVALAEGVTWVDTANVYAGGRSEEILADLLRPHDHLVVATKVGMPTPDVDGQPPLSPRAVRLAVEASLRRLRVEHVDLLYLHRPDRSTPVRRTLDAVDALIGEGKVGALGVSNYAAWQVAELNLAAKDTGGPTPVVGQQLYNMVARRLDEEYAEFAATSGLATVVYNPLAGGLLTGRHDFATTGVAGRFGTAAVAAQYRERYWDRRLFGAVDSLGEIAATAGISLLEMALRWTAGSAVATSVLVGASRAEQLIANFDALRGGPLTNDVLEAIDDVAADLRGPMPAYNR